MFYAPWCGHCKAFKPVYATAASSFSATQSGAKFARLDAAEHKRIGKEQRITGLPTIRAYFRGKMVKEFAGDRTLENLLTFAASVLVATDFQPARYVCMCVCVFVAEDF
jgi:thioredoxin-like negative regulator of GroEL